MANPSQLPDDGSDSNAIDLSTPPPDQEGMNAPMPPDTTPPEPSYPEFSIMDHPDGALMRLPEKGHALIKYHIKERSERKPDGKSKHKGKRYTVRMQVHSIKPHKIGKAKKRSKPLPGPEEDEAAIDAGLA